MPGAKGQVCCKCAACLAVCPGGIWRPRAKITAHLVRVQAARSRVSNVPEATPINAPPPRVQDPLRSTVPESQSSLEQEIAAVESTIPSLPANNSEEQDFADLEAQMFALTLGDEGSDLNRHSRLWSSRFDFQVDTETSLILPTLNSLPLDHLISGINNLSFNDSAPPPTSAAPAPSASTPYQTSNSMPSQTDSTPSQTTDSTLPQASKCPSKIAHLPVNSTAFNTAFNRPPKSPRLNANSTAGRTISNPLPKSSHIHNQCIRVLAAIELHILALGAELSQLLDATRVEQIGSELTELLHQVEKINRKSVLQEKNRLCKELRRLHDLYAARRNAFRNHTGPIEVNTGEIHTFVVLCVKLIAFKTITSYSQLTTRRNLSRFPFSWA
jgi:hypothetical protein